MTLISLTCNLEEVKTQVGQEGACLKEEEREITVLVHPKFTANQLTGVKRELDALSRRHSKELGGMVVAYDKVRLLSPRGWMFDSNPFVHMRVAARFYVFCPVTGDVLKAVVRKKAVHHLGCLAHGAYNVSVPRPNSEAVGEWAGTLACEGDTLTLTVLNTSLTNYCMPYIRAAVHPDCVKELKERQAETAGGRIEPKTSGLNQRITFDDDSGISSNEAEEGARGQKRKRSECEEEEEEEVEKIAKEEGVEEDKTSERSLNRKKRRREEEEEEEEEEDKGTAKKSIKKGKKRKRNEEEEEEEEEGEEDRTKRKKKKRRRDSTAVIMEESLIKEEKEKKKKEKKKKEEEEEEEEEKEAFNRIQIKVEKLSSDEEEEPRRRKKKKKKEEEEEEETAETVHIKQEVPEENERRKKGKRSREEKLANESGINQTEEEEKEEEEEEEEGTQTRKEKKKKEKEKRSIKEERVSADEGITQNGEPSLPIPLFMIKKEFSTPELKKKKVKKEKG